MKNKKKEKKRIFTFSNKILLLCIAPMVIICVLITFFSRQSLTDSVENEIEGALEIVAISLDETYSNLYKGDYEQDKSGRVTKGGVAISKNSQLIDGIKEHTDFEITLYFNELRLLTTLKRETGTPATGTEADPEVYERIMRGDSFFRPDVSLYGKTYYVYYQPLCNQDGTVVGGIAVAKDASLVKKSITAQTRRITIISIVLLAITCVVIVLLASRTVSVMKAIKQFLAQLAEGEFRIKPAQKYLSRNDELGDIFTSSVQLQNELCKIVDNIKSSSSDLIISADQLTDVAQDTRSTVDSVCQSMEGITNASVTQTEETTLAIGNVGKIGEEIGYISHIMDSLTHHAEQMSDAEQASERIIRELNNSNVETITSITNVAEQINTLHASVESIQAAISMIQSIAEETDLLSLNANIEAARAGEAGRGFSVVATQISKLAEQSNTTAEDVENIIANIVTESDRMVEVMADVTDKINKQQAMLDETMSKSNEVAHGVHNSLEDINSIRGKIDVLSQSGDAIQSIVNKLAELSEQNESSTQDTMNSALGMSDTMNSLENSSEKLKTLAKELDETLVKFKI
ncbi:MAG: methyl-accepting chemotaxis protein [Lachnospiraceae bacterium]|nr:methyl-accepting chemotaxis protein [Lachnospiraceae bacterium]